MNKLCKRKFERGGSELILVMIMAVVGISVGAYLLSHDPFKAAVLAESRHDLDSIRDSVVLALSDEQECKQAFTSAPLSALDYSGGDPGTVGMDMVAFASHGVTIASVGQDIVGGKINKVWLENSKVSPSLGGLRHFQPILKIQADSYATGNTISARIPIDVLVDGANKVQYCYLSDSVALRTCVGAGGVFDPTATPSCRFNFTDSKCATAHACVTGLDPLGNLLCSGVMTPPPPPPPPPTRCFCDGSCFPTTWMDGQPCRGLHETLGAWVDGPDKASVEATLPKFQCERLVGPNNPDQCLSNNISQADRDAWHCGDYQCAYREDYINRCVSLPVGTKPGGCP